MVITQSPSASPPNVTTFSSRGSSARFSLSFASCSSSSAKTTRHSESPRMYPVSAELVLG